MERISGHALKYPGTFSPGKIGKLELENRLIKAPLHSKLGSRDGTVTDRILDHYRKQAGGGVSLAIVEYAYVDNIASKSGICQISAADNEYIPGLSRLAQVIKDTGAKAGLQITHCGRQKFLPYLAAKSSSRVPWEELHAKGAKPVEELTFEEVQEIVKAFGEAALRAVLAGYDLLEVHGANGYLITNFLSQRTNKRTDWYGGSLENRMRFLLEVVAEIRKKIGPDFPFSVRLDGSEYEPDGVTIEETIEVAKVLETKGVDVIHVCGGNHHQTVHTIAPMFMPVANNVWAAEALKKVLHIPVIANGSINTAELIEDVVANGRADFVALGRPLYADPQLPRKMFEGRPEDIAYCIRCNEGCVEKSRRTYQAVQCTVNPTLGFEDIRSIVPAEKKRKVAVIGGGPAGMEAAIVSTLRGHDVTIFEKRKLGGVLTEASMPDFKADIRHLKDYLCTQVEKLGIKVNFKEATPQSIAKGGFDAAVIAIGSKQASADVHGAQSPMIVDALAVLRGEVKLGKNIVVVGAGYVGLELALYLGEKGKRVIVVECRDEYGTEYERGSFVALESRLVKCDVTIQTGRLVDSVLDKEVVVIDRFGKKQRIAAENVVFATGFEPQAWFRGKLASISGMPLFSIGDCVQPRKIFEAIHEGYMAGAAV